MNPNPNYTLLPKIKISIKNYPNSKAMLSIDMHPKNNSKGIMESLLMVKTQPIISSVPKKSTIKNNKTFPPPIIITTKKQIPLKHSPSVKNYYLAT